MTLDEEYVVKDGQVIIVDEFTGRLMPGRRWSDGLHQAVEAKENVKIESENQTLATITLQNYFRMYKKLAGMTGTADTEAVEFDKIYNLDVTIIPTNKAMVRHSYPDVVYRTEKEKFNAVVDEIKKMHEEGRPSLVGTVSIEKSERLSTLLKRTGIKHVVLNAKYHEKEAEIVAQAGQPAAVTIATNMAGRGTDIVLGEGVADTRRIAHHRHGAARSAAHRQPASRPRRPPGRSRILPLLPFPGRRFDAHFRKRSHCSDHAAVRNGRRSADRTQAGDEIDRTRAEAGGIPQLRNPQTPAGI